MALATHPKVKHPNFFLRPARFSDRIAETLGSLGSSMRMFWCLVIWQLIWMALATIGMPLLRHDPYPFTFLLFLGNLIQLWYLPLLGYLAAKGDKKHEAKAIADHMALTHIALQIDKILANQEKKHGKL